MPTEPIEFVHLRGGSYRIGREEFSEKLIGFAYVQRLLQSHEVNCLKLEGSDKASCPPLFDGSYQLVLDDKAFREIRERKAAVHIAAASQFEPPK